MVVGAKSAHCWEIMPGNAWNLALYIERDVDEQK